MNFEIHRPRDYKEQGKAALLRLIRDLKKVLFKTQNKFAYDTLRLPAPIVEDVAHVLVEFGEDLHNDLGLWRGLEQYNREFFGTPLPLVRPVEEAAADPPSTEERVRYFLWVLYTELDPELTLAPNHQDLQRLAGVVAGFLDDRFKKVPQGSGIKDFLAGPNRFGLEVKRKLIWVGLHSYLCRFSFKNYIQDQDEVDLNTFDDFVCQEFTAWSGLCVPDILAAVLPLSDSQRATLRSWPERHLSYYRVVQVKNSILEVVNLVNNQRYNFRVGDMEASFRSIEIIFGGLVPWEEEWYWVGEQLTYESVPEAKLQEAVEMITREGAQFVYRYDEGRLQRAREMLERLHRAFAGTFGGDFVLHADGPSMAAAHRDMYRLYEESLPGKVSSEGTEAPGDTATILEEPYPPELSEHDNGIGVFFNPEEGIEMMTNFNDVISGLAKRGGDLSEDETFALQEFIESESISPAFVKYVVQEHGAASIAEAYLIRGYEGQPYLDYLLRRYKGHFYRPRYPSIAVG